MEDFRRGLNPVLCRHLGVYKSVVLVPHKIHKGRGTVRKLVRLLNIRQESLLREAELHFGFEESDIIEIGHHPLDGQTVAHLHHGTALLGLQELDPDHVPVETEDVEYPAAGHLGAVEAVHHSHTAAAR